ncbi:polyprenyl synthetase family protein [Myxococcota bacterium]|nr:polyprenyl synthetase family protein [Myxococcota bacterium]
MSAVELEPLPVDALGACIEARLATLLPPADGLLGRAVHHAVFSGGRRVRPRLTLAVVESLEPTADERELGVLGACALELLHCASLVHDDLPAFDDATIRRGRPTVHALFGEAAAVLAGDALLARALDVASEAPPRLARRALRIVGVVGRSAGAAEGLIGGQSFELEPAPRGGWGPATVARYHAMKTASLFEACCEVGAAAVGHVDLSPFRDAGRALGMAYQLADDLADAGEARGFPGKPIGQDTRLDRPTRARWVDASTAAREISAHLDRAHAGLVDLARTSRPIDAIFAALREVLAPTEGVRATERSPPAEAPR